MFSLLRHGFVSLRRSPTLAFTIVTTLGVSLAAAVIVFSFLNSFLLRPLPYGEASRLLVYKALALCDAEGPRMTKWSAMAKCFASDAAMRITTDAEAVEQVAARLKWPCSRGWATPPSMRRASGSRPIRSLHEPCRRWQAC